MIKSIRIYDRLGNNSHTGAYSKSTHLDILHAAQSTNLNFCTTFIVEDRRIVSLCDDPKSVFWFRSELESLQGLSIIRNHGRSTDSSEGMATSSSCSCFSSWHPDVIEFEQMFLPMYALSVVGGSARFTEKQRALFFRHYFPWAIRAGGYDEHKSQVCVLREAFHKDLEDVRKKWGKIPCPDPKGNS
ncbi:unnamed protein product [Musa hybrid cultivar]